MKLTCNGLDLADAFTKVTKAITGKSNAPILEGVKMSAKGSILTLTATDTEVTIENTINANIMLEGDIVVPGKLTCELLRKMGGMPVELDCTDNKVLYINYLDSKSKINILDIEEYPKFSDNDYDLTLTMSQKQFKEVINGSLFSAATDDTRPILKGCLIQISNENMISVAIDGLRLAKTQCSITSDYKKNVVVPAKVLQDITKLMNDSDDIFTLKCNDKKIFVDLGDTKVIATQLVGEFIAYDRIIPKSFNTTINILKEQLEQALDRLSIISRANQANLIKIEVADNVMTLYANSEYGDICEKVPISMDGKDLKLAINSKFVYDCLRVISDEYIKISFSSSTEPFTINPVDSDKYLYLILPVRVMNN